MHQLLAGELKDDLAVVPGADERVVLLGGDAVHGLEPVGVVGHALFHRPVAHGTGDDIGHLGLQGTAVGYGLVQRLVGILGQTLLHDLVAEYVHAKELFQSGHGLDLLLQNGNGP